jgi:secretion/DNA translocation related CpaE-like protein
MAGQPLQVTGQPGEVARVCRSASLVVVDSAALDLAADSLSGVVSEVVMVTTDRGRLATWEAAVRVGARRVLTQPDDNAALLELLALAAEPGGPPGHLVGVMGGRGGAGASTLAVALSWAATETGRPVTLVDLDPYGGGLDVALGLERAEGLRWPQLCDTRGVVASAALRQQLPAIAGISVLSAAAPNASEDVVVAMPDRPAVAAVLDATRRGGGVVIADLPRWPGEVTDHVLAECAALVFVVPSEVRAVAAARTTARRLRTLCSDLRLVVRTDPQSRLRDRDVASALGIERIAAMRHESGLASAADRGELIRWLRRSRLGRCAKGIAGGLLAVAPDVNRD